jgi:hypothetical protein
MRRAQAAPTEVQKAKPINVVDGHAENSTTAVGWVDDRKPN